MSRLGDTIRSARLKAGMNEKQLGKKCSFAESVIKEIEGGRRIASDEQAQRILKILGVNNPVSTELEVAAEPPMAPRPRPKPYVLPLPEREDVPAPEPAESGLSPDAWRDALGGVVRRVPVTSADGMVLDHVLEPVTGGKIEGGAPEKVFYYRCPDDSLRGFRVHAGDLLLTVPCPKIVDNAIMVVQYRGARIARKVLKLDGGKVLLQSYDQEFASERVELSNLLVIGTCVRLMRRL